VAVNNSNAINYAEVDPRFLESVKWFRINGYNTIFAGFIGAIPAIRIEVEPGLTISDARILYCRLRDIGVCVDPRKSGRVVIEGVYDPAVRSGIITIYNVLDSILMPFVNASEA
jgi:hypothetical protein